MLSGKKIVIKAINTVFKNCKEAKRNSSGWMNSASSGKQLLTERGKRSSGSSTVFLVCLRGKRMG